MGGIFSSSQQGDGNCRVLDERSSYILVRNYVVVLKMIGLVDSILDNGSEEFNTISTNLAKYLVDSRSMLNFIKELPTDISQQFAMTEQRIIGVSDGSPTTQEVSFYDAYNNFFLVEVLNFDTYEEAEDRLKQLFDNLKKKAEIIESMITAMCVTEIAG